MNPSDPNYPAHIVAKAPGPTRHQLHLLFVESGLQRRVLITPLTLLLLFLVEHIVGSEQMIRGLQSRTALCYEQAHVLVDAHLEQQRQGNTFGIAWTQMSLESFRRAQFVGFAIGAPSGYGIQFALGILEELDRKIDFWLGSAGLVKR